VKRRCVIALAIGGVVLGCPGKPAEPDSGVAAAADTDTDADSDTDTDADTDSDTDTDVPDSGDSDTGTDTETGVPPDTGSFPEEPLFGHRDFIEYIPGELPIILVAPHGGYLEPEDLPTIDDHGRDNYTQETTRAVGEWLALLTGRQAHIVINHLNADKMNAARDLDEAAGEHPDARLAWAEFHEFIEMAKADITETHGAGHYVDVHGNGHDEGWTEIGLGVSPEVLNGSDEGIIERCDRSTVAHLCGPGGADMLEIIRGETSLGGLLMASGYLSLPSPDIPAPGDGGFFYAGWNTWEHGSRDGGTIDATHLENHWTFMVDDEREDFSLAIASSLVDFMSVHYGADL
jgi:hypothetical protein